MNRISNIINDSIEVKKEILNSDKLLKSIENAAEIIIEAYRNKKKVLFCGNGGSAADAQHLAAELSGRFYYDRPPLAAEALHVNTSYMTAVANDYSYDEVFARYIAGVGNHGDILVGLSTSGNSKNVIKAIEQAQRLGMKTVSLTGSTGGKMKDLSDILINVPSNDTPRIQESHIMIGHIICEIVESTLFLKP
ncbi:MAG TPA: D-sedoheptulose 7-phosphate isomerase [Bacteroidales bacterium]|mgnify:CR=1 FL=1|nr:D-sedoheptulose 7-phosphate isomerase [Bacteroidales bacterium]HOH21946.1 D-sedoheptulose 7-phosphate isomerase [Bacteroidales bacterium]HPZ03523.1 D-sedoheptulose 7-phosphate isomerase [Bacteroidales bacterium]HQB74867.1 D-sedoheptulose 7-phosphate isomerase [Bacteroidales bacterium]